MLTLQHQEFITDLIARSSASRLTSQEYPVSVEDRLTERRTQLIESLVNFSSSGRLTDQDSLPPTPRFKPTGDPTELVTADHFIRTMPPPNSPPRNGNGNGNALANDAMERQRSGSVGGGDDKGSAVGSGTFRKIKGLVRRGSIGLGLKVGPSYGMFTDTSPDPSRQSSSLRFWVCGA